MFASDKNTGDKQVGSTPITDYPTIFTDPVHPMNQAIKKYLNLYRIKYNSHEYHSKIRHDSSV